MIEKIFEDPFKKSALQNFVNGDTENSMQVDSEDEKIKFYKDTVQYIINVFKILCRSHKIEVIR